jgi:nicotinamide-nucleotide amidase
MRAEIISIGTELLLGDIVDTNAAWLAQQLAAAGVDVYFRTTVGDNVSRIAEVIRLALGRADVVITTGGLGPTVDDMTREGVAAATGRDLVLNEDLLVQIQERFKRWTMRMSENNVRQAYIPRGATPVENPVGTAPVFIVEQDGHYVISLPGVPREMKHLVETRVLPFLRERTGGEEIILSKVLRTCAIGESVLDHKIAELEQSANPTVGLSAHPGQTDVRITAKAKTRSEAETLIRDMEARLRERIDEWIYGVSGEKLEEVVARLLAARGVRLAILETNTQGQIAERLWATPEGASVLATARVLGGRETVDQVAAEKLAGEFLAETGADLALVVLSTVGGNADMYGDDTGETVIALARQGGVRTTRYTVGGTGELAQNWTLMRGLDLVRRELGRA